MPPEAPVTIRDGALLRSSPSSSFVDRNGPATFVAYVSSSPSAVAVHRAGRTPALWTSTSSRGSRARNAAAKRRVSPTSLVAQHHLDVRAPGVLDDLRAGLLAALGVVGQRRTPAPSRASPVAVAGPRPEVAAVTSATPPSMRSSSVSLQACRRSR
jgi:hypothetical protein